MLKFRKRRFLLYCVWEKNKIDARSDFRRIWPGLVISLVCLVVLLYLVDLEALVEALRLADYRFVLAGIVFL